MTEPLTFRCRIPKRELQQRFPTVSETLNMLLERELASHRPAQDWADVLQEDNPVLSYEEYAKCLLPE